MNARYSIFPDTLAVVVPRFVYQHSFMSKIDDKSGYHHILLSENSQQYFGIEWQGWWLVCVTLPFGWKNSPYPRNLGVACALYIVDRLDGELFTPVGFRSHPISQ